MNALGRRIARLIETQGPLSIAQFMTIALHDSKEGYYATREPFGTEGDFVTAPDISQIFGELVGLWCAQAWLDQGSPKPFELVELGPGRGSLMADALRAAKRVPGFLDAVQVVLVEASPRLREVQRARLEACGAKLGWCERYVSGRTPQFIVANEFFDALPIRQYVRTERGWCERMVVAESDGTLAFALSPLASALDADAPEGAVVEVSPAAEAIAEEIGATISGNGGAALVVDYGYASRGFGETLQAVGRHEFREILEAPGEVDLSAHVNFRRLADAAARGGATTYGPIEQGRFLLGLGIRERAGVLSRHNPQDAQSIDESVERLTDPERMGALFKALAIVPQASTKPSGF